MSSPDLIAQQQLPRVSVLVPVFNGARYVGGTIESVLAQTFPDFELLLFDDGSADNSLGILNRYRDLDSRVQVFTHANAGIVATRNKLVQLARGRYLAVLDHDDICLPGRLARQIAFLDSFQEVLAVGGWVEQINGQDQRIGIVEVPTAHEDIDRENLRGHCSLWHPASMIRRDAMLAVGCYRDGFDPAADFDLWLRLAETGKLANIPEVLVQYRLHANATSERQLRVQQDLCKRACRDAWA